MKIVKKLIIILIISFSSIFLLDSQDVIKIDNIFETLKNHLQADIGKYNQEEVMIQVANYEEALRFEKRIDGKIIKFSEYGFALFNLNNKRTINDLIEENQDDEDFISLLSPNYYAQSFQTNDRYYQNQTYLNLININNVWDQTKGEGIVVAIIDTGIDIDHNDLKNRASSISYNASTKQIGVSYVNDVSGHGTAVSGIIGAIQNNRTGITGIAPLSSLMVIKCEYKDNSFSSADLIEGIYYAANNGAHIINMSWGVETNNNIYKTVLEYASSKGVVMVAASGNAASKKFHYPAADKNVISVGATDNQLSLASYSNYGQEIDVVAPGTAFTTLNNGSYGTMNGTSFASPMVAGVIALYLSKNKNATISNLKDMLFASTKDLGNVGRDIYFGYGLIDADKLISSPQATITYNYQHHSLSSSIQYYIPNSKIKFTPLPSLQNYTFGGWYYDQNYENEFKINQDTISSNIVLYAKWIKGYVENHRDEFLLSTDGQKIILDGYIGSSSLVKIPDDISEIGEYAFYSVSLLKIISIPNSVETIKSFAFKNNISLEHLTIPSSVVNIDEFAVSDCKSVVIRAESSQKPTGWNSSWNSQNQQVLWDYMNYQFQVKFYNENGTTLLKTVYTHFGGVANVDFAVDKPATAQYSYIFSGWDKDISYIMNNISVRAVYEVILNQYTVTFYDEDGITVLGTSTVDYGESAIAPDVSDKPFDEMYFYEFSGWDKEIGYVTSNYSTKATYQKTLIKYMVTFYDDNGVTILGQMLVEYGTDAIAPIVHNKYISEQYHYEFVRWDRDFSNVTNNIDIIAIYEIKLNYYTVTFVNDDESFISSQIVDYGSSATAPDNPVKERTQQYTYAFLSWDQDFSYITSDLRIKAIYSKKINQYTITFYHDDHLTIIDQLLVDYGSSYMTNIIPQKTKTPQYTYEFLKWDKDTTYITEDINVYPIFNAIINQYTVTFYNGDDIFAAITVDYGDDIVLNSSPTKISNAQYTYVFTGWDQDISNIKQELVCYALFDAIVNEYQVSFIIEDIILTQTVLYGGNVVFPYNPEKYGYDFSGWDHDGENITDDTVITALFEIKKYVILFMVEDIIFEQFIVVHGESLNEIPAVPEKSGYEGNWDYEDFSFIIEDITVRAVYGQIFHTLTFKIEGMNDITRKVVDGGNLIDIPNVPNKTGYVGKWDKVNFNDIKADLLINAIYEIKKYTVIFLDEDQSIISTVVVEHGKSAIPPEVLNKEKTTDYIYAFDGWDHDLDNIVSDMTVTAKFKYIYLVYSVKFIDYDGSTVKILEVNHGTIIDEIEVIRAGYRFKGWYLNNEKFDFNTPIESNIILKAKWSKVYNCSTGFFNYRLFAFSSLFLAYFVYKRKKFI